MTPNLYFYTNLGTIQLNKGNSNAKSYSRPWLRDLEWQILNYYAACRGFSGFELDTEKSSHYILLNQEITDEELIEDYPNVLKANGERKEFIHPISNLSSWHPYHKGKALFENKMWNGMVLGSRDTGKSYISGVGIVLKEWLFDGAASYDEKSIRFPDMVDITVGAEDSQKSGLLLSKTKSALDRLPGSKIINGKLYPSPLTKQYHGSWVVGKQVIAEYDKKYTGG